MARLGFIVAKRLPGAANAAGLLHQEMDLLLALAAPIDQRQRDQFLHEVVAELEAAAAQTGVGIGPGAVHRVARTVQRRSFDPPQLASAGRK